MNKTTLWFAWLLAAAAQAAMAAPENGRSGKQVVDSVCASCHATGANGAPKIGDRAAWKKRIALGLSSLTQSALNGLRRMPAHGGNLDLLDIEIGRAVTYMVNRSGGHWVEPARPEDLAAERTGPQVVMEQCAKCHRQGVGGAPKIGDLAAWTPRLKDGLDNLVREALRGHGGMPPRGDRADLTDTEIRNAVLYMINPGAASTKGAPARKAPVAALVKSVGGIEMHLGFVPAETLRLFPEGSAERRMHGGVPGGKGYYHVNVSLFDAVSKAPIDDAKVEIRVEQPGLSGSSTALEPVRLGDATSYGNYVRLRAKSAYRIALRVRKPGAPQPVEATFDYRSD